MQDMKRLHGRLSVGTMAAFIAYIERLYSPLRRLVNSSTTLTQSFASMDRVFELMDEEYDIVDKKGASLLEHSRGEVTFSNVSFQYEKDGQYDFKECRFPCECRRNSSICRDEWWWKIDYY